MGFACPVCDVPQRDERHLADHLAFTAMLRADEHEAWLDEHVPDWNGQSPAELGDRVAALADETEFEEVFEDTVNDAQGRPTHRGDDGVDGGAHDHGHGHAHGQEPGRPDVDPSGFAGGAGDGGGGDLSPEARSVMEEARELTREMYDLDEDGESGDSDETGDDAVSDETSDDA